MDASQLPDGWCFTKICEISSKVEQRKPDNNENFYYIDIGCIDREKKKIVKPQFISGEKAPSRARKVINTGDVLVSLTRPNLNAVAHVPVELDGQIASTGFEVIRILLVNSRYIYGLSRSKNFVDTISGSVQGALYPAAKSSDVQAYKFPLPPLAEQKIIAEKLDTLLAQVETTKARLDRIPDILKRFRQSVLAAAVSGKLTEEWRISNQQSVDLKAISRAHAEFFCEKKSYKTPLHFSEIEKAELPCIPHGWEWIRAEQICDLITKGTTPKKNQMSSSGDVPFVKVYNLTFDGRLDFTVDPTFITYDVHNGALARSRIYPNDVLMNIVGPPLGKVSIVPETHDEWNMNQAISVFRPVCGVSSNYLCLCLRNAELLELVKSKAKATAGQFNLTLEICRDYPLPIPPISEQTIIVNIVENLFTHADTIEKQVQTAQVRVDSLTQSILAKAFRGELTADWRAANPELISGENSAEALLARIKAEREAAKPVRKKKAKAKAKSKAKAKKKV